MSAFDALREFTTATCYADFRTCCLAVGELRAAVAEHDALRRECDEARATAAQHLDALRSANDAVHAEVTALGALRDAVRGYLATLPREDGELPCDASMSCHEAAVATAASKADGRTIGVCETHQRHYLNVSPLPPRVVTLRALAALVRDDAPAPCDCSACGGTHRVVGAMGHERACDYCACVVAP